MIVLAEAGRIVVACDLCGQTQRLLGDPLSPQDALDEEAQAWLRHHKRRRHTREEIAAP